MIAVGDSRCRTRAGQRLFLRLPGKPQGARWLEGARIWARSGITTTRCGFPAILQRVSREDIANKGPAMASRNGEVYE